MKFPQSVTTLQNTGFIHSQVPSYTLSHGSAVVLAQGTSFGHHSDSPIQTFLETFDPRSSNSPRLFDAIGLDAAEELVAIR